MGGGRPLFGHRQRGLVSRSITRLFTHLTYRQVRQVVPMARRPVLLALLMKQRGQAESERNTRIWEKNCGAAFRRNRERNSTNHASLQIGRSNCPSRNSQFLAGGSVSILRTAKTTNKCPATETCEKLVQMFTTSTLPENRPNRVHPCSRRFVPSHNHQSTLTDTNGKPWSSPAHRN